MADGSEIDITVKMEGDDIFNLQTISSLSSQVQANLTNLLNTFETDVIDITGSDNINEKTDTLLSNISVKNLTLLSVCI